MFLIEVFYNCNYFYIVLSVCKTIVFDEFHVFYICCDDCLIKLVFY